MGGGGDSWDRSSDFALLEALGSGSSFALTLDKEKDLFPLLSHPLFLSRSLSRRPHLEARALVTPRLAHPFYPPLSYLPTKPALVSAIPSNSFLETSL